MKHLLLLLASLMLLSATFAIRSTNTSNRELRPGARAKFFCLKNIDGKRYAMVTDTEAKGYIVVFTSNRCPFAVAYEQRLIALHEKYAALGYPVIAVNSCNALRHKEDSYEFMQERAREKDFPFPYLHDEAQIVAKDYGASRTPQAFVLQRTGIDLIVKYVGNIDDNFYDVNGVKHKYVENAVDELLSGKTVSTPYTKTLGLSIKWKR